MGRWMFRRRSADGGGQAAETRETLAQVSAACVSDVGRSRDHNEDNFGEDAKLGLWVVADGMGGHAAGEVASDLAVSHIFRLVTDGMAVSEAVSKTHDLIRGAPSQGIGAPGMGTTVVAAQLTGGSYRIYWVGDSRAYLQGPEGLRRLTADHSYVQQLLDQGVITPEQAEVHPERSVITQCLGAEGLQAVQVSEVAGELYQGDLLLLCTDGLTGEVSEEDIAAVLGEEAPIGDKAQRLIDKANDNGGSDNITVALIPAPATARSKPEPRATRKIPSIGVAAAGRARRRRRVVAWGMAAVLVMAIAAAGWVWRVQFVELAQPVIAYVRALVGLDSNEAKTPAPQSSPKGMQEQDEAKEDDSGESQDGAPPSVGTVDEGVEPKKPRAVGPNSPQTEQESRSEGKPGVLSPDRKREKNQQQVVDDPAEESSVRGTFLPKKPESSSGTANGQGESP